MSHLRRYISGGTSSRPSANYRDHRYFEMFEEQSMICGPVNRALEDLGDYGVLEDVI